MRLGRTAAVAFLQEGRVGKVRAAVLNGPAEAHNDRLVAFVLGRREVASSADLGGKTTSRASGRRVGLQSRMSKRPSVSSRNDCWSQSNRWAQKRNAHQGGSREGRGRLW